MESPRLQEKQYDGAERRTQVREPDRRAVQVGRIATGSPEDDGDNRMGQVEVRIQVGNSRLGGDLEEVAALVDTGAVYTVLPGSLLEHLKVDQLGADEVAFADGSNTMWPMGEAWIVYGGKGRTCPVYFGPEDQYLLGVTALELHRLMIDPENQTLVPMPPVRGRSI